MHRFHENMSFDTVKENAEKILNILIEKSFSKCLPHISMNNLHFRRIFSRISLKGI